jgi:predicted transcriptional regulator of viral defense system
MINENIYRYKEVEKMYGSQYKVAAAVRRGELFRVARGVYSRRPGKDSFALIRVKYPYGIIAADTAYYLHGVTDVVPQTIHLATKRNATRIEEDGITQIFVSEKYFEPGKIEIEYDGNKLLIYDKERMLVEALRKSASMPFDYYKEIIASYRRIADGLDYRKIEEYINLYKRSEHLFEAFQREVM